MRKDELLNAAESLLADQGAGCLTLAAVAERAGVSKGGLLYHFATKEALIKALIERLIADFDELVAAQDESSYTRSYLAATLAAVRSGRLRRWAVVTGAAGDPQLLAPLREAMCRWHRAGMEAEADPMAAQIVRLACEGLWDVATHDPEIYDESQYEELHQRLLALLPSP
ncbi:TetR family transcriptional regulator [Sphaerisporangium melleum]|uniref:TetR family transcriptional regulator n=1 Tax=Sphaerisporangium melleum TaxID=321316 RepID=A0A917QW75_9ACTN|nr:TetR/AcrR family transcriptional regulator [Sphaerisporangium melleum]GGK71051.1 TetR family transcriptional regulator [Sphaerisporangium melleum]GII70227.1 TetR family transcriptional regulator [Sphaerisporangium melleum]